MRKCLLSVTLFVLAISMVVKSPIFGQQSVPKIKQFGYFDKGDSVQFVFGQQKSIKVGIVAISLDQRRDEIKQVNLAGDFNGWSPDSKKYLLKKIDNIIYTLTLSKADIGKKGETRQFKFVLNEKYWIEPPAEAENKLTGKERV
jgi:hypothetical protein